MEVEGLQERLHFPAGGLLVQAHPAGNPPKFAGVRRQSRCLTVLAELQPMLQLAQEDVGLAETGVFFVPEESLVGEAVQRQERVPLSEPGVFSAVLQLQRLHAELQLADAPPSELDVGVRAPLRAQSRVDTVLHRADLEDRVRVGSGGIDQRLDPLDEAAARGQTARSGPRLDQGLALPAFRPIPVVGQGGLERHGDVPVLPARAQTEIDPEDLSLGTPDPEHPEPLAGPSAAAG